MKRRIFARLLCLTLAGTLLVGCGSGLSGDTTDLMDGVEAQPVGVPGASGAGGAGAAADFGLRLFQETWQEGEENPLVSPLSVLTALAMTANGAGGDTLSQMEALLGLPVEELNLYLHDYTQALPQGENHQLDVANSIWFKDTESFQPGEDFLNANAAWYGAGLYQAPFDASTVQDINAWVEENTHGMIPSIVETIPDASVMYLVNALAFDAQWQDPYYEFQVQPGIFTTEDGTERDVEMMYSDQWCYLQDENASGFMKHYDGGGYAFAALLPHEGVSLRDYASSLTGEKLQGILAGARDVLVETALPKFRAEYSAGLNDILRNLGMTDAFDPALADFSAMGTSTEGPLFISQVLHKTFINVDEKGTQAGAATMVAMEAGASMPMEIQKVYLDRPFLYLIVDCQQGLPVFIGAITDIES